MSKIMIVDDDVYIGDMLEETLTLEGYSVLRAYSGTEALLLLRSETVDLILLDLMLPGLSGDNVLAQIPDIPVIVVSAKADPDEKVRLLTAGAADYITKPFNTRELLARIAVHLRLAASRERKNALTFGKLKLDLSAHTVTVEDVPVHLTKTEYAILKHLMKNPNAVVTKSNLLDLISEDTPDCMESSLKVHVSNLRRKLRDADRDSTDYIEAVWGIGFKMHSES